MLKVTTDRTFSRKITVLTPARDDYDEESFTVVFRYLDLEQTHAYDLDTRPGTTRFLEAVVVELSDLTDANDKPWAYDTTVRDIVFRMPNARAAIIAAYFDATGKVKLGN
jgi:hypothetical protein